MTGNILSKGLKYLMDSGYRFSVNASRFGIYHDMTDEEYLKRIFRYKMGYELDLENPKTFNEKLQWLKIHDRKPEYTMMVDKFEVKKYVADRIGEEFIIPTLGVWDHFDEIDFATLPDQFVLKCTHDSGGLSICRDKAIWDRQAAKKIIEKSLKRNFYWAGREWPYKNVKPRIIAEQYMEDTATRELRDYKIFTFDGVAKALFVATERQKAGGETKYDFFDMEFKYLPFTNGHPNAEVVPAKPKTFALMKELAEKLSKGIPHVRVDFYEVNGQTYFGELTFYHWSGLEPFEPAEWDQMFGYWIKLPENLGGGYCVIGDGYVVWLHEAVKPSNKGLTDYKFFCFNGKSEYIYISRGLEHHPTAEISFYDLNGNEMGFHRNDYKPYHNAAMPPEFDKMKDIANTLAKDVGNPFVRIDLYSIHSRIYFSEITFSPCAGFLPFEPATTDLEIGKLIRLPIGQNEP